MNKIKALSIFFNSYLNARKKMNRKEIDNQQANLFKKLLPVLQGCEFYKEFSIERLDDFPIINKKIMNENFNKINTVGLDFDACMNLNKRAEQNRDFSNTINNISIGSSSGTSGKPSLFAVSKMEQITWAGSILGKTVSLRSSQNIALFLRSNNNLYDQLNLGFIKFKFFDLYNNINNEVEILVDYKPTILVAPAQVLKLLAIKQSKGEINISPKKIYSAAEVLDQQTKTFIEDVFKIKVGQIYQATEGFLGITCEHGQLHLNEETIIVEKKYIDENRFIPIVTDLRRTTHPVVRYELDDILRTSHESCRCGRESIIIEQIEGRVGDTLSFTNSKKEVVSIFSDPILKIVTSIISYDIEFNIEQIDNNTINLYISNKEISESIINAMNQFFATHDVFDIKWVVVDFVFNIKNKRRKIYRKL